MLIKIFNNKNTGKHIIKSYQKGQSKTEGRLINRNYKNLGQNSIFRNL